MAITTQTETGQDGSGRDGVLSRWGALISVCLATLMMLVDFMAVSVALPAVGHTTGASFAQLQWVLEGFVVTLAAFVLTAGYIADLIGRRPVFLTGLAVFAVGALASGGSSAPLLLIGSRVAQGVGGALIFSTGTVLLTETFRLRPGPYVLAVWGTVTGLAVAFSPALGGLITTELGWRWIFWLEVPIALAAFAIGTIYIKEPAIVLTGAVAPAVANGRRAAAQPPGAAAEELPDPPDWRGLVLFTLAIVILVIGLVRTASTSNLGDFTQNGVIACFACTGLLLVAFVANEWVSPAPMLDISLFRQRTFTGSSIAAFGLSMAVLGPFMFLVLYLAYDQGNSALGIGVRLLLLTGMTVPFLPLTGWLDRYVPVKVLICGGLTLVAAGLWLMSRVTITSTWSYLVPGLLVAGVGLELVNPRLAQAAAATVKPHLAAVASRTSSTFRQLGTATGVAVFGAVFATRLTDDISQAISATPQLSTVGSAVIANLVLQGNFAKTYGLSAGGASDMLPIIHHSFADAIHQVFLVAGLVALGSAILALSVRSRDIPRADASPGSHRHLRTSSEPMAAMAPVPVPTAGTTAGTTAGAAADQTGVPRRPRPRVLAPMELKPFGDRPAKPAPAPPEAAPPDAGATPEPGAAPWPAEGPSAAAPASPTAASPTAVSPTAASPTAATSDTETPSAPTPLTPPTDGPPVAPGPASPEAEPPSAFSRQPGTPPDGGLPAGPSGPSTVKKLTEFLAGVRAIQEATLASLNAPSSLSGPAGPVSHNGVHPSTTEPTEPEAVPALVGAVDDARARSEGPGEDLPVAGPGPSLIDLTTRRSVRGQVTAATGEPLAGATVTLVGPQGEEAACVIAGDDGLFALNDLGEGTYTLVAAAPNYRAAASVVALRAQGALTSVSLLAIGSLTGKVTREKDGAPLWAEVELMNTEGAVVLECRSDKDGGFILPDVLEGSYTLVVHAAGYRSQTLAVQVTRGRTTSVALALTGVGHVYGAVAGAGGAWVPDAPVTLTDENGSVVAATTTDSAGSFHFPAVVEGRYKISTSVTKAASSEVDIDAGKAVAADLTLEAG